MQYGKAGILAVSLAIPTKCLHTINKMESLKDFNDYVDFLVAFTEEFDDTKYKKLLYR